MLGPRNYNPFYNYPGKEVWLGETWKGRESILLPLISCIQEKNKEDKREYFSKGKEVLDESPSFNYRYLDPEVIDAWKEKGMIYGNCGLDGHALMPEEFLQTRGNEPMTLLIPVQKKRTCADRIKDIFILYDEVLQMAAKERISVLFIPSDGSRPGPFIETLQEFCAFFHLKYKNLQLDVSSLCGAGIKLSQIEGFTMVDRDFQPVADPDALIKRQTSLEIPCLDITGIWGMADSLNWDLMRGRGPYPHYEELRAVNSGTGRNMAEGMVLEHAYRDAKDPGMIEHFRNMGLNCEFHTCHGEQYVTFTPRAVVKGLEKKGDFAPEGTYEEKIPLLIVMQEVNDVNSHQAITAFTYCYGFFDIAAQGDCMLLFFALETEEDNEVLTEMIAEIVEKYPVDPTRIYMAGHSHNGGLGRRYSFKHPDIIAALATQGNEAGLNPKAIEGPQTIACEYEDMEKMKTVDMPTVNISGGEEHMCMFPLYEEAPEILHARVTDVKGKRESINRRLETWNCTPLTEEEIEACRNSDSYPVRVLGIPESNGTKVSMVYMRGEEDYIARFRNKQGKYHLEIINLDNMPHCVTANMCDLSWAFLRRFARDRETGECIELF